MSNSTNVSLLLSTNSESYSKMENQESAGLYDNRFDGMYKVGRWTNASNIIIDRYKEHWKHCIVNPKLFIYPCYLSNIENYILFSI